MTRRPSPILPIDGVPPALIEILNSRLRDLAGATAILTVTAPILPPLVAPAPLPTTDTAVSIAGVLVVY